VRARGEGAKELDDEGELSGREGDRHGGQHGSERVQTWEGPLANEVG
jgi:hypothetical protein